MEHLSKIYFQQEDVIRKNSLQQTLCIQAMADRCRILIADEEKNIVLLEERASQSFLNKEWPFVNLRFAETKIMALAESFIFIPQEFETETVEHPFDSFLEASTPASKAALSGTNIHTHYTVDPQLLQIQSVLSESTVIPSANVLIPYILSIAPANEEYLGIHFYSDCFELVYVKNKQFIFYNRFPKESPDDFNFYLLSIFEQFDIQPAHAQFHLSGAVLEQDEYCLRLMKYTTHLHFPDSTLAVDGALENEAVVNSSFFLLSALSKCE